MKRQDGRCFYCGRGMVMLPDKVLMCTIDHVVPRANGGASSVHNYVAACAQCNSARGTINSALFKRYVRRFGPPKGRPASRHDAERARWHMTVNGLPASAINDILAVRLQEAMQRRAGLAQR